ncbi:transposable element Tc1 transposase [Trichonephila clavipes]|nr:transposable element Tc1 transposase [Trichonephila clavipes]
MHRRRIRAHHEQLSEYERGRIIELKEGVFSDEFSFQLCPNKHRRRVWRRTGQRADPAFTIEGHTGHQHGVIVWGAIYFEAGPLWSSLEAHLQHIAYQTLLWPAIIPLQSSMSGILWKGDCIYQGMLMTWPDNRSKFGYKYRRRPSACFITMSRRVAACIQDRAGSTPY